MARIRLREIAHGRSGDKGSDANIGVVAYTAAGFAHLRRVLTAQRVAEFLAPMKPTAVERYELAGIGALNFVCRGILAGGAARCLRVDPQGKALAGVLLEMEIDRPDDLAAMLRRPPA
jgi:hypothetical protein